MNSHIKLSFIPLLLLAITRIFCVEQGITKKNIRITKKLLQFNSTSKNRKSHASIATNHQKKGFIYSLYYFLNPWAKRKAQNYYNFKIYNIEKTITDLAKSNSDDDRVLLFFLKQQYKELDQAKTNKYILTVQDWDHVETYLMRQPNLDQKTNQLKDQVALASKYADTNITI